MYTPLRDALLRLLRAPTEPPDAPAGSHASVEVHRASPRYLTYRLVFLGVLAAVAALGLVVAVLASTLAGSLPGLLVVLLLFVPVAALLAIAYFAVRVDYELRYYIVTDRSLRVREGAIIVREMTVTHANVQNIRVVQGPLLRAFRIWNLEVDTAGGSSGGAEGEGRGSHRLRMAGIEDAHAVRDRILEHLRRRGHGTGLGDPDEDERGPAGLDSEATVEALAGLRDAVRGLASAARRASAAG